MLMAVKNQIKVMFLSIKYNLMKEMTNRVTFITNVLFMILNNATFIVQWIILFSLKDNFGGYLMEDIILLWAISSSSYGLAHILFNGIFKMPQMIENGKVDSFLVTPKNTLIMLATSSTRTSAIGDFLYGYVLMFLFYLNIHDILMFTILIIFGGLLYTSLACILNSLTFWFIRANYLSDSIIHIFINFSIYPDTIFNRAIKIMLFTIIPVGFAVYLPAKLILGFNITYLLLIFLATFIFVSLAFLIFYKGLKRYTSSNLMVARI